MDREYTLVSSNTLRLWYQAEIKCPFEYATLFGSAKPCTKTYSNSVLREGASWTVESTDGPRLMGLWAEKQLPDVANVNKGVLAIFDEALKEYQKLMRPLPTDFAWRPIHGDVGKTIPYDDDEKRGPPGIIDMTFYWSRAGHADAIVVSDG